MSKSWVPSGAIVNQGGRKVMVVPFGGIAKLTYVSGLVATFLKLRLTVSDLLSADMVTDGMFKLAGWPMDWPHHTLVAALIAKRSMKGIEHKKLI